MGLGSFMLQCLFCCCLSAYCTGYFDIRKVKYIHEWKDRFLCCFLSALSLKKKKIDALSPPTLITPTNMHGHKHTHTFSPPHTYHTLDLLSCTFMSLVNELTLVHLQDLFIGTKNPHVNSHLVCKPYFISLWPGLHRTSFSNDCCNSY